MEVDFGKTAKDYGRHRAGFPESFFDHLMRVGAVSAGDRVLDVGTGAGTVARGLARRGCIVTGLDLSDALLQQAQLLDSAAGVRIDYVAAHAEGTGLKSGSFDVVTAGQCWHWFDRSSAAAEAHRLLGSGGRLVIAHFDWIPLPGNVVSATESLIVKYNRDWARFANGTGLYPHWLGDLTATGFEDLQTFSFDVIASYSHESWRGRIRASAGIGASLPPGAVANFDDELAELLHSRFPDEPLAVHHRVWSVIGRRPD